MTHLLATATSTAPLNIAAMKILLLAPALLCLSFELFAASAGNPIKGEEIFQQCAACHQVGADAPNTVGPNLNHLFGRTAGSVEDANYSDAMRAKGADESLIWNEKTLFQFIAGPQRYVPDTIMGFEGLRTEKKIKNVLAYLIQFSPAYEADSLAAVDPEVAAGTALPVISSTLEEEPVPEFTDEFLASSTAIENGGELWATQCRHCHGNSAYPGKAPKLRPSAYTPDFVFDRVTNGFRKMPAWKSVFTLEQRKELVANILSSEFAP
ncbi:c-type cytochrome [Granulosicoccus antarcticus]|uniref:Cytochrome c2 n=1 Tax=Granulosicoccus antarcticus IMCC3135 TaxID=1192854 RepID=A0A2Z2NWF9_9GAMM|nr:c-type cytochrome [Granulosicoccus antarcticus]ASJ73160.1 Cytochrome c2 [Granulosicoccus antarcticus IMCC3135]